MFVLPTAERGGRHVGRSRRDLPAIADTAVWTARRSHAAEMGRTRPNAAHFEEKLARARRWEPSWNEELLMSEHRRFRRSVDTAAQGDADALTDLFHEFHPALSRYLRSQVRGDADDVESEVWICVARGLPDFAGDRDAFRRWLFTIASRRVTDARRRTGRAPTFVELDPDVMATRDRHTDLGDRLHADEAAARLLAALTPEQAEVVALRVLGGLSADEVAEVTGRSSEAVRALQHRALSRLARRLEREKAEAR